MARKSLWIFVVLVAGCASESDPSRQLILESISPDQSWSVRLCKACPEPPTAWVEVCDRQKVIVATIPLRVGSFESCTEPDQRFPTLTCGNETAIVGDNYRFHEAGYGPGIFLEIRKSDFLTKDGLAP